MAEKDLSNGVDGYILGYKVVDVDAPGNRHFVYDFGLYTKSVVIVEQRGGKTVRYKVLPKIWQYIRDENRLKKYIVDEVKAFIRKGASR